MKISVLMSVYNEPLTWLNDSINSILNQTLGDFEFIIVLDNPDNTEVLELVKLLENKDSRIRVVLNSKNLGLTKSLNIGLRLARGKYIARMDADDISYPKRFQTQYDYMEKNEDVVACGAAIKRFGIQNRISFFETDPIEISINFTRPNPYLSPIAHPTAFFRRDVLITHNIKYNESYLSAQDYGLWSDLLFHGKLSNINEVLLDYRTSENQITTKKRKEQLKYVSIIIRKHIERWGKLHKQDFTGLINLRAIESMRQQLSTEIELRTLKSFEYGLILSDSYSWFSTLLFFVKNPCFEMSFLEKIKIIIKKAIN